MANFKVGDRVRCVVGTHYVSKCATGTVKGKTLTGYWVKWDESARIRPNEDNTWAISENNIEPEQPEPKEITVAELKKLQESIRSQPRQIPLSEWINPNTDGTIASVIDDIIKLDKARLARIERWAGLAMQGMLSDVVTSGSYVEIAEYAFNYADAMEAEYQRRYFNTNENANETE
jgi:hypothetical protein